MSEAKPAPQRPSVLSLNINSKSALYAAFMPHLKAGGIFIPTTRSYRIGDEVFMLLSLMDDPAKLPIAGTVVWVTPAGAQNGRAQGIGVHFNNDEQRPGSPAQDRGLARWRHAVGASHAYPLIDFMLVDSHCHLDFPDLVGRLPEVLQRMRENQVALAVCIGVNLEDFPKVLALAEAQPNLYATVGVHPEYT